MPKKYTRKTLLYVFLLSLSFSSLSTFSAHAVSVYDNSYQSTSDVVLSNTASGSRGACVPTSYTSDLASLFDNASNPYTNQRIEINNMKTSYMNALENGRWGVSQFEDSTDGSKGIHIYWTEDVSLALSWEGEAGNYRIRPLGNDLKSISFVTQAAWLGNSNCEPYARFALTTYNPWASQQNQSYKNFFVHANNYNYPSGYEGAPITSSTDSDSDGLSEALELTQGTSDNNSDSDEDGLSDYTESQWNPNRNDIFCGVECTYPNPLKKDIYVEVDWMDSGSTAYKPTNTQLNLVKSAFTAKDINLHMDTGQYGGGNELPTYISELKFEPALGDTDFFNLKNGDETYDANFPESRRGIWHYIISGYKQNVNNSNTATGVSYAGDDDAFIAMGRVKELVSPSNEDTAIAGTIIHELGHNLCLSDTSYTGQDSSCLFAGVDHSVGNNYASSMNYDKQLSLVDYSEGLNSTGDHDDWSAVLLGMNDFVTLGEDPTEDAFRRGPMFNKQPLY